MESHCNISQGLSSYFDGQVNPIGRHWDTGHHRCERAVVISWRITAFWKRHTVFCGSTIISSDVESLEEQNYAPSHKSTEHALHIELNSDTALQWWYLKWVRAFCLFSCISLAAVTALKSSLCHQFHQLYTNFRNFRWNRCLNNILLLRCIMESVGPRSFASLPIVQ